jgi:hypothetical protein
MAAQWRGANIELWKLKPPLGVPVDETDLIDTGPVSLLPLSSVFADKPCLAGGQILRLSVQRSEFAIKRGRLRIVAYQALGLGLRFGAIKAWHSCDYGCGCS